MGKDVETVEEVVAQMKFLVEAIPARPAADEVEAAKVAMREEERSLTAKLAELFAQPCPSTVPAPVFQALLDLHEAVIRTQSEVRRRDVAFVLQLDERHRFLDDLLRKAELSLPDKTPETFSLDNNHVEDSDDGRPRRSFSGPLPATQEKAPDSRPKLLVAEAGGLVARTYEEGRTLFDARSVPGIQQPRTIVAIPGVKGETGALPNQKLFAEESVPLSDDQDELLGARWPPNLLGILETAEQGGKQPESLNFSNGGYNWLPESIGLLNNLRSLNLSGNQLTALPETLGELANLTDLDLEANLLKSLPESIGDLTCLKKLNIEKNSIEEIPWTIGGCTSLVELRADFNQLKALPEAIGQLRELKFLSVHLNCLKSLPTTMSSLTSLTDLFVNFNHLDTLPESICTLTGLTRLDASSNFAEFRHLPSQIGNLQGLKDLDLSFNHITVLPDSFALLTNLRRLNLEGNPWRSPPLEVVAQGKDAVLEYMVRLKERELEVKKTSNWKLVALVLNFISKCRRPKTSTENQFAKIAA